MLHLVDRQRGTGRNLLEWNHSASGLATEHHLHQAQQADLGYKYM